MGQISVPVQSESVLIQSSEVKRILSAIVTKRIREQVRLQAFNDAKQLRQAGRNTTHVFAELEALLGDREKLDSVQQRFQQGLCSRLSVPGKTIENHLHALRLQGNELYDVLTGNKDMPYVSLDFSQVIPMALVKEAQLQIPSVTSGEVFYEYWLWFFRHARKQAIARNAEREDA